MNQRVYMLIWGMFFFFFNFSLLSAKEKGFRYKSSDQIVLNGKLALPDGLLAKNVKKVVILIHGSGPQNMDMNLTRITKKKVTNKVFCDVRDALLKKGFAVLRYNKRSYEWRKILIKNRLAMQKKSFKAFFKNPLKYFIDDVKSMISLAKKHFPKAKIYLLGFSQGTYVALQVAHSDKRVAGVALVGFYTVPLLVISFEQLVYRPLYFLCRLDKNHDGYLVLSELKKAGKVGMQLAIQMRVLDANQDGKLSFMEIQAGNLINLHKFQKKLISHTLQELRNPAVYEILQQSKFKVLFFQGLWDNQTPAYHALSIRISAKFLWLKKNMRFFFFPKLGHILDKRDRYDDVYFSPIDKKALSKMMNQMNLFFQ